MYLFNLIIPISLFIIGLFGVLLSRRNIILLLMSLEIVILSLNYTFLMFSCYFDNSLGEIFTLFLLCVAAVESSIGLSLVVIYYKVCIRTGEFNISQNLNGSLFSHNLKHLL